MQKSTALSPSDSRLSEVLGISDVFAHLSPLQLHNIENISIIREYEADQYLFFEGEESRYFHFLLAGEVAIIKSASESGTIALHRFRAPSMIAEMANLRKIPYPATAQCTTHSTVLKLQRDPFLALLADDPTLGITIISSLASKISVLEQSLQRLSAPNAVAKVARLLHDDADIFVRSKAFDIAHHLGITPETLSRTLKRLKQSGIIVPIKPRGFAINDSVTLNSLMENNYPLRD